MLRKQFHVVKTFDMVVKRYYVAEKLLEKSHFLYHVLVQLNNYYWCFLKEIPTNRKWRGFSIVQLTLFNSNPNQNALFYIFIIDTNLFCQHNPVAVVTLLENRITGGTRHRQKSWTEARSALL